MRGYKLDHPFLENNPDLDTATPVLQQENGAEQYEEEAKPLTKYLQLILQLHCKMHGFAKYTCRKCRYPHLECMSKQITCTLCK